MNCNRKLPSEHLQCLAHSPLKNYRLRFLSLGHMARPGVKGLTKGSSQVQQMQQTHNLWNNRLRVNIPCRI